jgi:aminoglycoside phosphotransferase (APT) family kinase protein
MWSAVYTGTGVASAGVLDMDSGGKNGSGLYSCSAVRPIGKANATTRAAAGFSCLIIPQKPCSVVHTVVSAMLSVLGQPIVQTRLPVVEMNQLQAQLRLLLKEIFGSKTELLDYRISKRRHDYLVLVARLGPPTLEVVLKLAGPEAHLRSPFERTAMLHQLIARRTTLRIAEVLAVDTSYQTVPWRYFVMTYVPGQTWSQVRGKLTSQELEAAFGQLGRAVAELHAICFSAFGEVNTTGTVEANGSLFAALQMRAQQGIQRLPLRQLFLSVLEQHAALFAQTREASLCHEDLHGHNLLFDRCAGTWQLAAILDFEKAWAGPAEADLARLELWQGMTSPAFWQAYQASHAIAPEYTQRRLIHQLFWCLEYARPTAEHTANTERVCRALEIVWSGRFDEFG